MPRAEFALPRSLRDRLVAAILDGSDRGEGHRGVAEWREGHERFWHGEDVRAALEDPHFTGDDATPVVLERFRHVADLRPAG
ncbi:hypothetical protein ABZ613_17240 [Streptomyces collinus]|uniref:hypothetical protein n=1 Tax=Streptomyces collinus TaxID=42684 RepID=UPI0033F8C259